MQMGENEMSEELEKQLDEEKLEHLVTRIREVYDNGALKIRDWIAMYELLIDACEREKAATMEKILIDCLHEEDTSEEEK